MTDDTATYLDRDTTIRRIKAALKRRSGKSWSVTGGKGTAFGWVKIDAPPRARTWHFVETGGRDEHGNFNYEEVNDPSRPYGHMGPADRAELAELLGVDAHYQGVSIPDGNDYRREYVDRSEGREPAEIGQPYWD